jgi:hypothetical protein
MDYLHEALRTATDSGAFAPCITALPLAALLQADDGNHHQAIELYTLACRFPYVANSRWFEHVVGQHIDTAVARLPQEEVAAAQERGRARDLWATATSLVAE